MIVNLIFTDSFHFMNQRLSTVANNLLKAVFYHTENAFGSINLELMTKNVYIPIIIWMILINSKKTDYHQ